MARRHEDDYDDEDDQPYGQSRERGASKGFGVLLLSGLAVGLILVGVMVFFVFRTRNAVQQVTDQAAAERQAALEHLAKRGQASTGPQRTAGANWAKLIGTWSRQPAETEQGGYPYRFEFRADRTCTTTRTGPGGEPVQQDASVEIVADQNNSVRLALIVPTGRYVYSFQLKPDGSLVLDNGKDGLVFTQLK